MVDRWVGMLLQKIEDMGLLNKTVIIFTTGHGFYHGEHGLVGKSLITGEFKGYVPLYQRINGAFKVLERLTGTFGIPPKYPERIIDSVFKHYEDPSYEMTGCNEFDNIWVLAAALRATDYRREEIRELVLSRLPLIEPFRKPDEGASRDMRRYHVPRQACDLG